MSDTKHTVVVPIRLGDTEPYIELFRRPLPTLVISPRAYLDTRYIIEAVPESEAAWLGSIEILPGERYLLKQVYLFEQTATRTQCVIDSRDLNRFYTEALRAGGTQREEAASIRFWGHLHPPGEPAVPSLQDEVMLAAFDHNPFFIRGIYTKEGSCHVTFVDYQQGWKIHRCPCEVMVPIEDVGERAAAIAREVAEKVHVRGPRVVRVRGRQRKGGRP